MTGDTWGWETEYRAVVGEGWKDAKGNILGRGHSLCRALAPVRSQRCEEGSGWGWGGVLPCGAVSLHSPWIQHCGMSGGTLPT